MKAAKLKDSFGARYNDAYVIAEAKNHYFGKG
jgi:hypothetical protein